MTIKERALAQFPGGKEWGDHDDVTQSQRRAAYELGANEERDRCIRVMQKFISELWTANYFRAAIESPIPIEKMVQEVLMDDSYVSE